MTTLLLAALGALAAVFILIKVLSPRRPFIIAQFTIVILLWLAWSYGVWRFVLFPDHWTSHAMVSGFAGLIILGTLALLLPVLLAVTPRHIRRLHSPLG
jgi:hypothetical protein